MTCKLLSLSLYCILCLRCRHVLFSFTNKYFDHVLQSFNKCSSHPHKPLRCRIADGHSRDAHFFFSEGESENPRKKAENSAELENNTFFRFPFSGHARSVSQSISQSGQSGQSANLILSFSFPVSCPIQ